jgi:hypothetical protein
MTFTIMMTDSGSSTSSNPPDLSVISAATGSNSAASVSSAFEDIRRLIAPCDRPGFDAMLKHELRGRELPNDELRHLAEDVWWNFNRYGWPRDAT